jgi:hypothetical protein
MAVTAIFKRPRQGAFGFRHQLRFAPADKDYSDDDQDQCLALRRTLPRTLRCSGARLSEPKALGHFGRGVLRVTSALVADAIPRRSLVVP